MTTTIHSILEEFRAAATSNRDLGDKFERLLATYLVTDPLYQDKYSDVWLWGEWPDRGNRPDVGSIPLTEFFNCNAILSGSIRLPGRKGNRIDRVNRVLLCLGGNGSFAWFD